MILMIKHFKKEKKEERGGGENATTELHIDIGYMTSIHNKTNCLCQWEAYKSMYDNKNTHTQLERKKYQYFWEEGGDEKREV